MVIMIRVADVKPLGGHRVRLTFTNGSQKDLDLGPFLHGPVFEPLARNPEMFRAVRVDPELGTIVWPNGADIDPDVLYHGWAPASLES